MLALVPALATVVALRTPGPLSPRAASYALDVRLDAERHEVGGQARIRWRNLAAGPADALVFHLYMNAFRDEDTSFLREWRGERPRAPDGFGGIEISRLRAGGRDLTAALRVEETLATLPLPAPIPPGGELQLELTFTTRLPRVIARTGWTEGFFAIAQWFPKLAPFSCDAGTCRFRAHPHRALSEFFADYGEYDVTLDAPAGYEVAATGVEVARRDAGGRRSWSFHAADVHDFALAASPRFTVHTRAIEDGLGPLEVRLYAMPGHEPNAERHLTAATATLRDLERRFGPYPYRRLSLVDVPAAAARAGAMEYPTLVFVHDSPAPLGLHTPEAVTVHEIAHQYFYGMVASDEVEEPWIDEGISEALTDWGLSRLFGRDRAIYALLGHHIGQEEVNRLRYRAHAGEAPPDRSAVAYRDASTYFGLVYAKTDLALRTLEGLVGAARVEAGLRRVFERGRFAHPRGAELEAALAEGAGEELSWFLGPVLHGSSALDYELVELARPHDARPEVLVVRRGEPALPIAIEVVFADGSTRRESWDGGRADGVPWRRFSYDRPVAAAEIAPETRPSLDVNRWNDGLRRRADARPRWRTLADVGVALSALLALVGP